MWTFTEHEDEDEWEDVPQLSPSYSRVAVECAACGAVSKLRYHISREGFSFDCSKCRKRASLRAAQKKYYEGKKAKAQADLADAKHRLIARINRMIDKNAAKIAKHKEDVNVHGVVPQARILKIFNRRIQIDKYYRSVRGKMYSDIGRGDYKPFLSYLNDDDTYEKFFPSKPATTKPRGG